MSIRRFLIFLSDFFLQVKVLLKNLKHCGMDFKINKENLWLVSLKIQASDTGLFRHFEFICHQTGVGVKRSF
jgi:hypothetical protein